jgi:hypothetical protein
MVLIQPDDLAAIDEFHIDGKAATEHLAGQLDLMPGMSVLDIGSRALEMARLIGMTDLAPASDIYVTQFTPIAAKA